MTREYWYLRLTSWMTQSRAMKNMEKVGGMYGYAFCWIYVKLCVEATPGGGLLVIPKTASERSYVIDLSKDLGVEPDLLGNAMTYYVNNGLVEITDNFEEVQLKFDYVINNTGKSSFEADRQRLSDRRKRAILENKRPKEVPKAYGEFHNLLLLDNEYEALCGSIREGVIDSVLAVVSAYKKGNEETGMSDFELVRWYAKRTGRWSESTGALTKV